MEVDNDVGRVERHNQVLRVVGDRVDVKIVVAEPNRPASATAQDARTTAKSTFTRSCVAGNMLLRPLVNYINRRPIDERATEVIYTIHVVCDHEGSPTHGICSSCN